MLEWRSGRCNYHQDYNWPAVKEVRVSYLSFCTKCKLGMHKSCWDTWHKIRWGIQVDLAYEVNLVQSSTYTLKQFPCGYNTKFEHRHIKPDIHNGDEQPGGKVRLKDPW